MYVWFVNIKVKQDSIDAFIEATLDNARHSLQEPGIIRFDLLQNSDDPTRFALHEVYTSPQEADRHKETAHYANWRDTVTEMMVEPRTSVKFDNVFPDDSGWG